MEQIAVNERRSPDERGAKALQVAATLWLLIAFVGQGLFVFYILGFYGYASIIGNIVAWSRNKNLIDGYVPGDAIGNATFGLHVIFAAVLTFCATLQMVPQIRKRSLAFHRLNGRLFMTVAIAAALAGLYLQWVRGTAFHGKDSGIVEALGTGLNGALILIFVALAWRAARRRDIGSHRRWAVRLFLVVNGVWFLRIGFRAWLLITQGALHAVPFFAIWSFACYLLPLAMYQWYERAKVRAISEQLAAAGALVVLAGLTAAGSAAAFFQGWLPLLSAHRSPQ